MNVSEFLWKRLQEWGLKRAYGYPGDGAGGIDVALQKEIDAGNIDYVQVRHEEMAAFMATPMPNSPARWDFVLPHPAPAPSIF